MTVKLAAFLALLLITESSNSQILKGIIMDSKTTQQLPYANIGVRGKQIGGISDQQGNFTINLAGARQEDVLVISYVGYQSLEFHISKLKFNETLVIKLDPIARHLDEVVVRSKREIVELGNKGKSYRHTGWGDFASSRGRAIGLMIPAYEIPVRVNSLFFHINACEFDSVLIRINLFQQEGEILVPLESQLKNIFHTIKQKKGWVEVRILDDIILNNTNVIVAIEWLDAWAKPRSMEEGGSYIFTISLMKKSGYHYQRQSPEEHIQLTYSPYTPSIYLGCTPTWFLCPIPFAKAYPLQLM